MNPAFYFILFGLSILAGCAIPNVEGSFAKVFGKVDTISVSNGGDVKLFTQAAAEVLEKGWRVRIDGPCKSACALFADKARPNICVTSNAMFGFHKATITGAFIKPVAAMNGMRLKGGESTYEIKEDPPFSEDIAAWVAAHGGFPEKEVLRMNAAVASSFWPVCK